MIINGSGFVNQRLYLFPEFYEKLPVERLIKEGIEPSDLNDDVLAQLSHPKIKTPIQQPYTLKISADSWS